MSKTKFFLKLGQGWPNFASLVFLNFSQMTIQGAKNINENLLQNYQDLLQVKLAILTR